ncbi:hypothetical protein [Paraburkholderia sp. A2RI-6]|uniref:hypothetical protein n=1 Tax=Paraburkholderia sp. A2RI-6 TaxID=3028371 RepID=UPI003BA39E2A
MLDTPAIEQQAEPLFASNKLDYLQLDTLVKRCLREYFVRATLIGKCHFDRSACGWLNFVAPVSGLQGQLQR